MQPLHIKDKSGTEMPHHTGAVSGSPVFSIAAAGALRVERRFPFSCAVGGAGF